MTLENINSNIEFASRLGEISTEPIDANKPDLFDALIAENITFASFAMHTRDLQDMRDSSREEMDITTSREILSAYPSIPATEYTKLFEQANNYRQLNSLAIYKDRQYRDINRIAEEGLMAIPYSIGTGLLDPIGLIIGGGIGKIGQTSIQAYNVTSRYGVRTMQGLTAGTAGLASVYALEESKGQDMAGVDALASFGIGATLGFALTRTNSVSNNIDDAIDTSTRVNNLSNPTQGKETLMIKGLSGPVDNMRALDDIASINTANKIKPSIIANDTNLEMTVDDVIRKIDKQYTHTTAKEYSDFIDNDFVKETGRKFTVEDDRIITSTGLELDFKYNSLKTQYYKLIDDGRLSKLDKNSDEYKALHKEIREQSIELAKRDLDNIIAQLNPAYRKGIEIIATYKAKIGSMMNEAKLNGREDLDTNFYWSKELDEYKIRENPIGARDAFVNAMIDNYKPEDVTKEILAGLQIKAQNMVDNILGRKNVDEMLDVDRDILTDINANLKPSYLQGRKLEYNGAKMIDFMKDNNIDSIINYGNKMSGKIALKQILDIDDLYTASRYAADNNMSQEGRVLFNQSLRGIYKTRMLNPRADTVPARIIDTLQNINYATLGGWFGLNTLTDLAVIANKYGTGRMIKYFTQDLVSALNRDKSVGSKLAHYLGTAMEVVVSSKSVLLGNNVSSSSYRTGFEKFTRDASKFTSKYSGLNMMVDTMDRVAGVTALDYIQTANLNNKKVINILNQIGLSRSDAIALRQSGAIIIKDGVVKDFDISKLDSKLLAKFEMGVGRAIDNVILKGNELDMPEWLVAFMGSQEVSKLLFPFMRFPIIAYNKIQRDLYHNFDAVDFIGASITALVLNGMIAQLKEVGKEEKRYDLSTSEGQLATVMYALDKNAILPTVGLLNQYTDVLGSIQDKINGDETGSYMKAYGNMGITPQRIYDTYTAVKNVINGEERANDIIKLKSLMLPNLPFLQPVSNIVNDEIRNEY